MCVKNTMAVMAVCAVALLNGETGAAPNNEEEWIVNQTVADLDRLANLRAGKYGVVELKVSPSGSRRYTVVGGKLAKPVKLQLRDHIWDAEGFSPLAAALVQGSNLKAAPSPRDLPSPAEELLTPTAAALENLNAVYSQAIAKSPGSADLHRKAAFLCGVFALREQSGHFHDTRTILSRMTAHMAMAHALDKGAGLEKSIEGRLLAPLINVLTGREKLAVAGLAARRAGSSPEATWRRSLDLMVRMDWRPYGASSGKDPATLLERIAFFRALAYCADPHLAIQRLVGWNEVSEVPDWSRVLLKYDASVQVGHFCNEMLGYELRDAAITLGLKSKELNAQGIQELVSLLNTPPEQKSGDSYAIITRGDWARHGQRHLLQYALRQIPWMEKMWGVQEASDEFQETLGSLYTELSLFPLAGFECWSSFSGSERSASIRKAEELAKTDPSAVVARRWGELDAEGASMPSSRNWFTELVPYGTQYNVYNRRKINGSDAFRGTELAKIRSMAPYDNATVNYRSREIMERGAGVAQLKKEFGDAVDYHLGLARIVAEISKDNPREYIAAMKRVVAINPDQHGALAVFLLEQGRDAEAMESFQRLIDEGNNSIRGANMSGLLMHYYLAEGNKAKAREVAEFSAEVYSYRGLQTMIDFCIVTGDADAALEWAKKLDERYDDSLPTMVVCAQFPQFAKREGYDRFIKGLFPKGMQKVALSDFKGEPADGVRLDGESGYARRADIDEQDVIVAVQGYRISNDEQYMFARDLDPAYETNLIIWDEQAEKYREIKTAIPNRRFGTKLLNY